MRVHLAVFHNNLEYYKNNLDKITNSAVSFGADTVNIYTFENLPANNSQKTFIQNNTYPGLASQIAFYCFKPVVILDMLKKIPENDIVLYHDVGRPCYNYEIKSNIRPFINYVIENYGGVGVSKGPWLQRQWCKRDCYVFMDCDDERYYSANHSVATWNVWQNNNLGRHLASEWDKWSFDDRKIITDEKSICGLPEIAGFEAHRWDQSILTNLIMKRHLTVNDTRYLEVRGGWEKDINSYLNL